jgi:hypothetical protein
MGSLGPTKISSNYQKLLQTNDNGMVADGTGSLVTLNLSGSEYYDSGSGVADALMSLTVTGSVIPEGSGSWDLGSEDSPFRHLYITNESLILVDLTKGKQDKERKVHLKASDISGWLEGTFDKKVDPDTKQRLITPVASSIQNIVTEPFEYDSNRDLYPIDLVKADTVQDTYWANSSEYHENLYLKPTRFGIVGMNTDDLEIV